MPNDNQENIPEFREIVQERYRRLWPRCQRMLLKWCPQLRLEDAEDIYQEAFIAVHENIARGKVAPNTSWDSYIIRICINLGLKHLRDVNIPESIDDDFREVPDNGGGGDIQDGNGMKPKSPFGDEDSDILRNPEVQAIIGDELMRTPWLCAEIIRLVYYGDSLSMKEIAEELRLKNADTAKARKNQCMKKFVDRLTKQLTAAGFNLIPQRWLENNNDPSQDQQPLTQSKRHGKN